MSLSGSIQSLTLVFYPHHVLYDTSINLLYFSPSLEHSVVICPLQQSSLCDPARHPVCFNVWRHPCVGLLKPIWVLLWGWVSEGMKGEKSQHAVLTNEREATLGGTGEEGAKWGVREEVEYNVFSIHWTVNWHILKTTWSNADEIYKAQHLFSLIPLLSSGLETVSIDLKHVKNTWKHVICPYHSC